MNLDMEGTMKLRRVDLIAWLGVLTVLTCVPLSAQRTPRGEGPATDVKEGEWVRVRFGGGGDQVIEGSLQGIEEDGLLVLSPEGTQTSRIPMDRVREFRVLRGSKNQALMGLGVGLAGGAVVGGLIGLADGDDESGFIRFSAGEKAAMGAVAFGLIGGAAGLVIGAVSRTDRWERASLPALTPSVQVAPNGRLGVRISIPTRR
jgi:hypothetical protein